MFGPLKQAVAGALHVELEATAYDVCPIDVSERMRRADFNDVSWKFGDMVLGSNNYIELHASQTHMCGLEDNDADGAGWVHCFKLEALELVGEYDVYQAPQHVVCTLDDLGEISCIDVNTDAGSSDVDEDSILENAPEGSYHQLAGNPNNVGMFMCAPQGHEVSCWGDGWNDGVPQTFDFAD